MAWPGLGRLTMEAFFAKDSYLVVDCVVMATALLVVGNFIADLLLAWSDPRIRLEIKMETAATQSRSAEAHAHRAVALAAFLAAACKRRKHRDVRRRSILIFLYLDGAFRRIYRALSIMNGMDRDRFFIRRSGRDCQGFHLVVPRYEQLPGDFVYRAVPSDTKPLHFFVRGDKYKLFGLIPASIHLFGTAMTIIRFICSARTSSDAIFFRGCFTARKFRCPSA